MDILTYNPKKVTCALGKHIASGFADDSFITIDLVGDGTTYVVGCDGEVVRSIDPSDAYTIKISLLQTSPTHSFLQNMYEKDKKSSDGIFSITIKDLLGDIQFSGAQAWVTKPATFIRGKAQNNREWEIVAAHAEFK